VVNEKLHEAMLAVEFTIDEHARFVKGEFEVVRKGLGDGFRQVNIKLCLQDGHPPFAPFAAFDCREREQCLEGTRTSILDQIYRWIGIGDKERADSVSDSNRVDQGTQTTDIQDQTILWINGSAGTEKTTIATTAAKVCRARRMLAASFFCSRDDADCSSPNLIFMTIAYQLGVFCPPFKD